jgi:hypothetical protein
MRGLLPVAALLVALTGCGGDAGGEPPPAEPPTSLPPMDSGKALVLTDVGWRVAEDLTEKGS